MPPSATIIENWPLVMPKAANTLSNRRASSRAAFCAAKHRQPSRTSSTTEIGIRLASVMMC